MSSGGRPYSPGGILGSRMRRERACCGPARQRDSQLHVTLNACRVTNELCWFQKENRTKEGKHKSKSPREPRSASGVAGVRVGGRWCRQGGGGSIQQMVYSTDDWQFSLFPAPLPLQPGGQKKGKPEVGRCDGACSQKQQAGRAQISPRRFL